MWYFHNQNVECSESNVGECHTHTYGLEIHCPYVILQGQLHLPTPFLQANLEYTQTSRAPRSFHLLPLYRQDLHQCPPEAEMYLLCQPSWHCFFLGLRKEHDPSYIINNEMITKTQLFMSLIVQRDICSICALDPILFSSPWSMNPPLRLLYYLFPSNSSPSDFHFQPR